MESNLTHMNSEGIGYTHTHIIACSKHNIIFIATFTGIIIKFFQRGYYIPYCNVHIRSIIFHGSHYNYVECFHTPKSSHDFILL